MYMKFTMTCLVIAAIAAFTVPAASAAPVLTESGVAQPVGVSLKFKNTGFSLFGESFNAQCSSAEMNGTLTSNTGTKIKAEVPVGSAIYTGTGTSGDCTSALGAAKATVNSKLCLETVSGTDNVSITGCGANVVTTLEVTGTGPCKYSAPSMTGTYVTNAGFTIKISVQLLLKSEGGIFCPSQGALSIHFDVYKTGGTALTIS
jgi:hypothetical protein